MILSIRELIGRFHPLLVHLPVGILLLAGLFQLLSRKEKFASLKTATRIALGWGMISAVASCITGFLLSGSGDYDLQLVTAHQWFGISVAVVSMIAYLLSKKKNRLAKWIVLIMVILIVITGHLGGSLTHGSDYLVKGFSAVNTDAAGQRKPIPDVQEAVVYTDIVQPILQSRCYSCHNGNKKKGSLRLDQPGFILKGGKGGEVIKPGNADQSEMIKRVLLPRNHDDHMPPKEKPQLKETEIELLHWWITSGASFNKKSKELEQPEKIKPLLLALQKEEKKTPPDVPAASTEKADAAVIQQLKQREIIVMPVAQNSPYLSVNFVTADSVTDKDLALLLPLKKQLVWLKLSNKKISDEGLKIIGQLYNLTRLHLDHTLITGKGLISLQTLTNLQYLNLVGTKITAQGLLQLKNLPKLLSVYVYKTEIVMNEWTELKKNFPQTLIDSGRYLVPVFESDTTEIKTANPVRK